jgi:hypothetical protein
MTKSLTSSCTLTHIATLVFVYVARLHFTQKRSPQYAQVSKALYFHHKEKKECPFMNIFKSTIFIFIFIMISSCGTVATYDVKPDLVKEFKLLSPPNKDETLIYVIRGSAPTGGWRLVDVGVNQKVKAQLGDSTHTFFKVKSGINTIGLIQSGRAFTYLALDNRPGETVFLYLDYEVGTLTEARDQLGKTMVQETTFTEKLSQEKVTEAMAGVLLNPGWLKLDYMMEGINTQNGRVDNTSIISIVRPGIEFKQAILDFWSDNKGLLGFLGGESYLQIRVKPGTHKIYTYLNQLSVVSIDVQPNNHYVLKVDFQRGFGKTKTKLTPVNAVEDINKVKNWFSTLSLKTPNLDKLNRPEVLLRSDQGKNYLEGIDFEGSENIKIKEMAQSFAYPI